MCLLTYRIHVTIWLIIILTHGRFVIALEIATPLANNAPVDTLNRFRLIEIETANDNEQCDHLLFNTVIMPVLRPNLKV